MLQHPAGTSGCDQKLAVQKLRKTQYALGNYINAKQSCTTKARTKAFVTHKSKQKPIKGCKLITLSTQLLFFALLPVVYVIVY
jgi:hypothetical protein